MSSRAGKYRNKSAIILRLRTFNRSVAEGHSFGKKILSGKIRLSVKACFSVKKKISKEKNN